MLSLFCNRVACACLIIFILSLRVQMSVAFSITVTKTNGRPFSSLMLDFFNLWIMNSFVWIEIRMIPEKIENEGSEETVILY